ncbi:MAG: UbiH/UbiF/VisC/COQ6 family ubiquinone biosynthesis hydroxylase, partial [Gammaproteobacteria bacterium]|nr:UbiH/UbiF/VisC/COQ6 family ubiquinone biosynthesis hydroxylase [Gammaproteobacteria bacterium]
MKSNYDIVIVGGGMVGAALACTLGNSALKVALLDRAPVAHPPDQGYDLRVSALTLAARALFENLGAWDGMARRRVAPVREMQVWSGAGNGSIHFNAAEIGEPALAYIVENSVIQLALIERLHQFTNVHHLCPVEVTDITLADNGAVVTLKDGRSLSAKLLVGADGANSEVRRAAGIETQSLDLHQKGIVATVTTEQPHAATARQVFLTTGPLAFLPLDEPHTCSIVWSADSARADQLLALDDAAFILELQKSFGDSLGLIQKISPRAAFPLALSHARAYTAAHLALVGDAAHTVHPLAGQGVNLGFLDAATLAEVLLDATAKQKDIGAHEVLRRYERWRKGDNLAMVSITGGFKYLFGNDLPVVSQLRNW